MKYYNKKNKKQEGWIVKNIRPEEMLQDPFLYYTKDEVEKYSKSGGMKRAQQEIAFKILDLIKVKKSEKILDVGCGVGYTLEVFQSQGYKIDGIDLIQEMVDKAKKNGFKVKQADMKNLNKVIKKERYNLIISISALQWIKEKEELQQVAKSFFHVLKKNGRAVIQFYPKSKQELLMILEVFKKNGFSGNELIENEDDPRKRLVFLILKKE
jgi:18S rRNA (guanine1575-N7)-methyltransferase